jgi:hypothetical protein
LGAYEDSVALLGVEQYVHTSTPKHLICGVIKDAVRVVHEKSLLQIYFLIILLLVERNPRLWAVSTPGQYNPWIAK